MRKENCFSSVSSASSVVKGSFRVPTSSNRYGIREVDKKENCFSSASSVVKDFSRSAPHIFGSWDQKREALNPASGLLQAARNALNQSCGMNRLGQRQKIVTLLPRFHHQIERRRLP